MLFSKSLQTFCHRHIHPSLSFFFIIPAVRKNNQHKAVAKRQLTVAEEKNYIIIRFQLPKNLLISPPSKTVLFTVYTIAAAPVPASANVVSPASTGKKKKPAIGTIHDLYRLFHFFTLSQMVFFRFLRFSIDHPFPSL